MKVGKIIFIDSFENLTEEILEKLKENELVEFAAEKNPEFYTLSEAMLCLLRKGAKKIIGTSLSCSEKFEIPLYWTTY